MTRATLAGAGLLLIGLVVGALRLDGALSPEVEPIPAMDLDAARERLRGSSDPAMAAARLLDQDPELAFILSLSPGDLPESTRPVLRAAALPAPLLQALVEETGRSPVEIGAAFEGLAEPTVEQALLSTLAGLLAGEDLDLARGAAVAACGLGPRGISVAEQARPSNPAGEALRLMVRGCGLDPTEAEALLVDHLVPGDPLGPVAALELVRLGRRSAIPALQAVARTDDLLGLTATYGVRALSSATSTQPSGPR